MIEIIRKLIGKIQINKVRLVNRERYLKFLEKKYFILFKKYKYIQFRYCNIENTTYDNSSILSSLLDIMDGLENTINLWNNEFKKTKEGIKIILKLLRSLFKKNNVKQIIPKKFDDFNPYYHQAIININKPYRSNLIFNVLQKGYIVNGKVIRPALVSVTKFSK